MTSVEVCSECGSARFENRVANGKMSRNSDGDYYCLDCHAHFDDPDERPAIVEPSGGGELAAELANADVDVFDSECRDCGEPLAAGYLCDDCDELEIH